jgi:hypothetical protein
MGYTRVIYTDATTAEAATVLKGIGFVEGTQGGLFTNQASIVKIYVVWGKSAYFPEIFGKLDFVPRIQVHLKSRENGPELADLTGKATADFGSISPTTKIRVFNADSGEEIRC